MLSSQMPQAEARAEVSTSNRRASHLPFQPFPFKGKSSRAASTLRLHHLSTAALYGARRVKDFGDMMKQAQGLQQKLQDAQARLADMQVEGQAGAGLVTVTMKGTGEMASARVDESLLTPGEGEMVSDLLVAAHADAKRKLDEAQSRTMQEALGPLAGLAGGMGGMPGLPPGFKF